MTAIPPLIVGDDGTSDVGRGSSDPAYRTVVDLIAPLDLSVFLGDYYGHRPVIVRGPGDRYDGLMDWDDVNRALRATHLEWLSPETEGTAKRDRVLATVDGRAIDPLEIFDEIESLRRNRVRRLSAGPLTAQLRRRATLLMREVDYLVDSVADLAAVLERDLGDPVAVAALASFTPTPGLGLHVDEQDSLILQIDGRKAWKIWEPTRKFPVHNDTELAPQPTGEPLVDTVLSRGDLAYVPRGWFHSVAALEEPSLHLTINVYKRTGIDLLRWIVEHCSRDEVSRMDMPRHSEPGVRRERGRRLAEAISDAIGDPACLVDRYLSHVDRSAVPRRPTFSLPWSADTELLWDDDATVRLVAPRGLGDIATCGDDRVRFEVTGSTWTLTKLQFDAVRPLVGGDPVTWQRLRDESPTGFAETDLVVLVRDLMLAGLVAVESGTYRR